MVIFICRPLSEHVDRASQTPRPWHSYRHFFGGEQIPSSALKQTKESAAFWVSFLLVWSGDYELCCRNRAQRSTQLAG